MLVPVQEHAASVRAREFRATPVLRLLTPFLDPEAPKAPPPPTNLPSTIFVSGSVGVDRAKSRVREREFVRGRGAEVRLSVKLRALIVCAVRGGSVWKKNPTFCPWMRAHEQ